MKGDKELCVGKGSERIVSSTDSSGAAAGVCCGPNRALWSHHTVAISKLAPLRLEVFNLQLPSCADQ